MKNTKENTDTPQPLKRAAIYARMSTEHQQYSTENQTDTILVYAATHGMEVVRSYVDEGKSGLRIEGRAALRKLLDDVQGGKADFEAILIYDVSRWGRFQDVDESAHYEYICRRAGINVIFCAEQFENDGSPVSAVFKGLKRAMAGEYSRELSSKVFKGQCRLIQLGYRQGGMAGYGLRRVLIDVAGNVKGDLKFGEHKSIQTDRVVLALGSAEEVKNVTWMFRQFVEEGRAESQIAEELNRRGVLTDLGRQWTRSTVRQVLTNEKYIGNNVYNRISYKLKKKRVQNPADLWIRADGVFDPVVDPALFWRARQIIIERARRFTDEELIEGLRGLYQEIGYLSSVIIDECEALPSSCAVGHRFGGLLRAYQLVGYQPDKDFAYLEINRWLRQLHPVVVTDVVTEMTRLGGSVVRDEGTELLTVNDEFTVSLVIARCQQTGAGAFRWNIRLDSLLKPDITVVVRMDSANETALDYYLLPALDMSFPRLRLAQYNPLALDAYRFDTLEFLHRLARRVTIEAA